MNLIKAILRWLTSEKALQFVLLGAFFLILWLILCIMGSVGIGFFNSLCGRI